MLLADGAGSVSWSPDGRWITLKKVSGNWGPEYTHDFYGAGHRGASQPDPQQPRF